MAKQENLGKIQKTHEILNDILIIHVNHNGINITGLNEMYSVHYNNLHVANRPCTSSQYIL